MLEVPGRILLLSQRLIKEPALQVGVGKVRVELEHPGVLGQGMVEVPRGPMTIASIPEIIVQRFLPHDDRMEQKCRAIFPIVCSL